jgi:hypothetical protein
MDPRYIEIEKLSPAVRMGIIVIFFIFAIMALGFLIAMYSSIPLNNRYMSASYAPLAKSSATSSVKSCRAFSAPQDILRLSTRNDPKINTGISLNGQLLVELIVRDSPVKPELVYRSQKRLTPLNDMFVSDGPDSWKLSATHMTTLGIDDTVYIPNVDSTNITYTIANVIDYPNLRRFALENNAIAFRPRFMFQLETNTWLPITTC